MRARALLAASVVAVAAGCLPPMDDPSTVKDLRVLGVRFDPPEVFIRGCNPMLFGALIAATNADAGVVLPEQLQQLLAASAGQALDYTALIADPAGGGRQLRYRLLVCANPTDRRCRNEGDFLELKSGETQPGELHATLSLGALLLPDAQATPLLLEVIDQDLYKGLGGIRVPVVLDVSAPGTDEHVYAQKLMVYQCPFFRSMKQNVQPVLPGVQLEGEPWTTPRRLSGAGPFAVEPDDFSALEEPYVVPSLAFKEVFLNESWKVSWYTTSGTMSPNTTGGTDVVTGAGRHQVEWAPDPKVKSPVDVTFYMVVRDGRGGLSWLTREAHWSP